MLLAEWRQGGLAGRGEQKVVVTPKNIEGTVLCKVEARRQQQKKNNTAATRQCVMYFPFLFVHSPPQSGAAPIK